MARFLTGINYWPRRSAMAMWEALDLGEIGDDFARIASLGLDVVRFFLIWEEFQPEPKRMDREALRKLDSVVDLLAQHRLKAMPTLFTGHMSGVNWLPPWTLDHERKAERFRTLPRAANSRTGSATFIPTAICSLRNVSTCGRSASVSAVTRRCLHGTWETNSPICASPTARVTPPNGRNA